MFCNQKYSNLGYYTDLPQSPWSFVIHTFSFLCFKLRSFDLTLRYSCYQNLTICQFYNSIYSTHSEFCTSNSKAGKISLTFCYLLQISPAILEVRHTEPSVYTVVGIVCSKQTFPHLLYLFF